MKKAIQKKHQEVSQTLNYFCRRCFWRLSEANESGEGEQASRGGRVNVVESLLVQMSQKLGQISAAETTVARLTHHRSFLRPFAMLGALQVSDEKRLVVREAGADVALVGWEGIRPFPFDESLSEVMSRS